MMRKFAEDTDVAPEKSRMEIEMTVKRYGATSFYSGWDETNAAAIIGFQIENRVVQFKLRIPPIEEFAGTVKVAYGNTRKRKPEEMEVARKQEERRRWRALALAIKAKLEVVSSKIATLEQEFLAHVVLPDGSTVGDWVGPQIEQAYTERKMPRMLPSMGETSR